MGLVDLKKCSVSLWYLLFLYHKIIFPSSGCSKKAYYWSTPGMKNTIAKKDKMISFFLFRHQHNKMRENVDQKGNNSAIFLVLLGNKYVPTHIVNTHKPKHYIIDILLYY